MIDINKSTSQTNIINNKQDSRNLGLFSATLLLIGNVMGVGVFFKNISIFNGNGNNPIGVLLAWTIGAMIAISTALCFGKICNRTKTGNENSGLSGWTESILGKKFGNFVHVLLPLCYFGFLTLLLCIMMSEALVEIFTSSLGGNVHFGFIILIAIVGVISFISLNVFAQHFGIKFSKFMTLVKFVPIIAVVLTGLIYGGINGISSSYFNMSSNNTTVGKFLPLAMLASLPAVLFAYDGFAAIGSLRSKIKEPEKNIPKAMLLAMLVVWVVFISITLSEIFAGVSSVFDLIPKICKNRAMELAINIILNCFIWICLIASCNGLTIATVNTAQAAIEERKICGSDFLLKITKNHRYLAGGVLFLIMSIFYVVILGVPCIILNGDAVIDGASNAIVVMFFVIYGMIISVALIKNKMFNWKLSICAVVSSLSCFGVALYTAIYSGLIVWIINANDKSSLGMLMGNTLNNWEAAVIFWTSIALFIAIPMINNFVVNRKNINK